MGFWNKFKKIIQKTDETKDNLQAKGVPVPAVVSLPVEIANFIVSMFTKKDK